MKTIVITGGTRGLGFELAKAFVREGFNVAVCGTRERTVEEAVCALRDINGAGGVLGGVCDVSDVDALGAFADRVSEAFGQIHIWVNNAGVNQGDKLIWELPNEQIQNLMNIDLRGVINGSIVATRIMIKQGCGAIFNVEGMGSNDVFQPRLSIYGTTKRAVTYFTDALANEFKSEGLPLVACKLSPGVMLTDFLTSAGSDRGVTELDAGKKRFYSIMGDKPDVIAAFLSKKMLAAPKNGGRIAWLTGPKIVFRFMTASFKKRNTID